MSRLGLQARPVSIATARVAGVGNQMRHFYVEENQSTFFSCWENSKSFLYTYVLNLWVFLMRRYLALDFVRPCSVSVFFVCFYGR